MIHFKTISELDKADGFSPPENPLEYHNNPDEFSKFIILSHLDSMLKYAQRFYKGQFIDRKPYRPGADSSLCNCGSKKYASWR